MRKQSYGRIVVTSSVAGIFGNFGQVRVGMCDTGSTADTGQANYSAAKLGLVGLSSTLSQEGAKYNIHSNVIVPMAASRMTEGIIPAEMLEQLAPDHIAPVVAWLCHEDCPASGQVVEALAGWAGAYRWQRSQGAVLGQVRSHGHMVTWSQGHMVTWSHGMVTSPAQAATMESVRAQWDKVVDFSGGDFPSSHQEATMEVIMRLNQAKSGVNILTRYLHSRSFIKNIFRMNEKA